MVFCIALLFADSAPPVFTARTAKYQVHWSSAATVALVAGSIVTCAGLVWGLLDLRSVAKGSEEPDVSVTLGPAFVRVKLRAF